MSDLGPRGRAIAYLAITAIGLFALFPFYWMVSNALKPESEVRRFPPTWYPHGVTLANFRAALEGGDLLLSLRTSLFVAILTTVLTVGIGSLAAYATAHCRDRGSRLFLGATLFTQLLPQAAALTPVYLLWRDLGLLDSRIGLALIYVALTLAVSVWMQTAYFEALPHELVEAGRIDGASHLVILGQIILPAALPALAAIATFTFLFSWSEFLFALVFQSSRESVTATVTLSNLIGEHGVDAGTLLAASTIVVAPVLAVFILFQRYFVSGLTVGAVKQ